MSFVSQLLKARRKQLKALHICSLGVPEFPACHPYRSSDSFGSEGSGVFSDVESYTGVGFGRAVRVSLLTLAYMERRVGREHMSPCQDTVLMPAPHRKTAPAPVPGRADALRTPCEHSQGSGMSCCVLKGRAGRSERLLWDSMEPMDRNEAVTTDAHWSPFPLPPQTLSDANLLQLITAANAAAAFIKIRGMPDYFHAQWELWGRACTNCFPNTSHHGRCRNGVGMPWGWGCPKYRPLVEDRWTDGRTTPIGDSRHPGYSMDTSRWKISSSVPWEHVPANSPVPVPRAGCAPAEQRREGAERAVGRSAAAARCEFLGGFL
ncbi:uncharacterized protein LOC110403319 [Numida meleagris]|uniref:uncharacterized protein LOC110403319 n=1 Tax=Numida meleagris TaxID=8996 RepID=UPI000B3DBBAE|nr:uncharacterized protein LOC110403319 [Numida meleagris]XP_021262105.1 uncharacterized protein LOC110403319 [Numida meleagris]XP_021262106.1 uncharacterized protein LOC110403319 [Numida meleagris]